MGRIKTEFEIWLDHNYPLYVYRDGTVDLPLTTLGTLVEEFILEKAAEANRNTQEEVKPNKDYDTHQKLREAIAKSKPRMTPEEFDRRLKEICNRP